MKPSRRALQAGLLRQLAVEADVDPRTIKRVFDGQVVRGMAGRRAFEALVHAGLLALDQQNPEER
jgi:hypothetical protein